MHFGKKKFSLMIENINNIIQQIVNTLNILTGTKVKTKLPT